MKALNLKKLEKELIKTFNNYYSGDGLYVSIDSISALFLDEEDMNDPCYDIEIRYGRECEDRAKNFQIIFNLSGVKAKDNIKFICGRFYQALTDNDI